MTSAALVRRRNGRSRSSERERPGQVMSFLPCKQLLTSHVLIKGLLWGLEHWLFLYHTSLDTDVQGYSPWHPLPLQFLFLLGRGHPSGVHVFFSFFKTVLIYSVVIISAVQQRDSVKYIHTSILF